MSSSTCNRDNTGVFIKNISTQVKKGNLRDTFSKYGDIKRLDIKRKAGTPVRYAFINYGTHKEAEDAIHAANGLLLLGKKLKVEFCRERKTEKRNGYRKNLVEINNNILCDTFEYNESSLPFKQHNGSKRADVSSIQNENIVCGNENKTYLKPGKENKGKMIDDQRIPLRVDSYTGMKSQNRKEEAIEHCGSNASLKLPLKDDEQQIKITDQTSRKEQNGVQPSARRVSFRNMTVFPTAHDMKQGSDPYLRPIKSRGAYYGPYQYLETLFRLLREDLVSPLREGIQEITANIPGSERKIDLKVYQEITMLYPLFTHGGVTYRIQFDPMKSNTSEIPWVYSRRLINQSLLCLSKDGFQTMIFAIVADRCPEGLEQGIFDIKFVNSAEGIDYFLGANSIQMVESPAYFEAYKHVLQVIKDIVPHKIPMKKYIIECRVDVMEPTYISKKNEGVEMNNQMSPISNRTRHKVSKEITYDLSHALNDKMKKLKIHREECWPSYRHTKFNESQFNAFKHALTKELVVIQGPPGSGKTYVSTYIADALLRNKNHWNPYDNCPMVLVCYTNHALDQFLDGLIKFGHLNIIRVGGRAKEDLKMFNLRDSIVQERRGDYELEEIAKKKFELFRLKDAMESDMVKYKRCIVNVNDCVSKGTLVHFSALRNVISEQHGRKFQKLDAKCRKLNISVFEVYLKLLTLPGNAIETISVIRNSDCNSKSKISDLVNSTNGKGVGASVEGEGNILSKRWNNDRNFYRTDKNFKVDGDDESDNNPMIIVDSDGFQVVQQSRYKRKMKMRKNIQTYNAMTISEVNDVEDPWSLELSERWRLYKYWISIMLQRPLEIFKKKTKEYENICSRLDRLREEEHEIVLKRADLIAFTTSGAARYRNVLENIGPKIVLVEEAAEVLEAHVLTSLNSSVEHLLLIGDHQQLRPKPEVYELAKKYKLETSLFERMINNNVEYHTLGVQHRMRPEISLPLRNIYPNLKDSESVKSYPPVKGVSKNYLFINHCENEMTADESKSKHNIHEAVFISCLCLYFLKQGYKSSQITVLSTYTGQIMQLRKLMDKAEFNGVRVTTVDNFQGEENDIILLSLVRSNANDVIGFCQEENRVCVSLSRAKQGFFVLGNFEMFSRKSNLWANILKDAKEIGCYDDRIKLVCQNHPNDTVTVKNIDDFKHVPEGGCLRLCLSPLLCNHICMKHCHPVDQEHVCEYRCTELCLKITCKYHHLCSKRCHYLEDCGDCETLVEKEMDKCKHVQKVACSIDPKLINCKQEPCVKTLVCGHICQQCSRRTCTDYPCRMPVEKLLKCGHVTFVPCNEAQNKTLCMTEVSWRSFCGHTRTAACSQKKKIKPCEEMTRKMLACGHRQIARCHDVDIKCVHPSCSPSFQSLGVELDELKSIERDFSQLDLRETCLLV